MLSKELNWASGEVSFWDLDFLDPAKPLSEQLEDLKEDLAQVQYQGERLLDIGWFPEFALDGAFVVRVVDSSDWDSPLFLERSTSVTEMVSSIPRAVAAAEKPGAAQER
jgi:predicted amidohydrolase YtcJ